MTLRLGVLGSADIAFRRFLPALGKVPGVEYAGVASRKLEKTAPFVEQYGGLGYLGYQQMLDDPSIDAVYIPLPPAAHADWAVRALQAGKHVLLEKPAATTLEETQAIVAVARSEKRALHVNYAYAYHAQLDELKRIVASGQIGEVRLLRIRFGFPLRESSDFRYHSELGGGALLDCGCYTIHLAAEFLGSPARVTWAQSVSDGRFDVDLYGSAVLEGTGGLVAQVAYGMDNDYRNDLEIWGSLGSLHATRIFTTPSNITPPARLTTRTQSIDVLLPADDQFQRSIEHFMRTIESDDLREAAYLAAIRQTELIDNVRKAALS